MSLLSPLPLPLPIEGLGDVFNRYDGFILDLWGVVHDGVEPFPTTIETLLALKKARKKVWLLSNAPRRAKMVALKLQSMGIADDLYTGMLTSGEAAWHALRSELLEKWGHRCVHLGAAERDSSVLEDLDLEVVKDPLKADFILNTGVEDFSDTPEKYLPFLKKCAENKLPMLCANPDRIVHVQESLVICAGTLADVYLSLDGEVTWFGKPYRTVYSRCLQDMGTRRVLAVGDSMITDIAGATGAGLDSVLVTSGIHREEFPDLKLDNNITPDGLERFFASYPYRPTYVMKGFSW